MPFILFPRQVQLVQFLHQLIKADAHGLIEKSRDMGATWICACFSIWLWLFWPGSAVGWGSRKETLVDRRGDPNSIFEKLRIVIRGLPAVFLPPKLKPRLHLGSLNIINPANGATIVGEIGDNIGRGGRTSLFFKDESAHYEHPEMIEAALGDNTNVQIDISSVHGIGNVFHRRRESGVEWQGSVVKDRVNVFIADWSHHPAKTPEWHETRRAKAEAEGLLHVFAQEVDRDYAASLDGVCIPGAWIKAAVDAHKRLRIPDEGPWVGGLDVADAGLDTNAIVLRRGVVLHEADQWRANFVDVTARRAIEFCGARSVELQYDCIGVGAGVKAEANRLQEAGHMPSNVHLVGWDAAASPFWADEPLIPGDMESPLHGDTFGNLKAQGWWFLRRRFEKTYRMLKGEATYPLDELISIDSGIAHLYSVLKELGQPVFGRSSSMRMIIDKTPTGTKSPNLGDGVMMCYWPEVSGYTLDFI